MKAKIRLNWPKLNTRFTAAPQHVIPSQHVPQVQVIVLVLMPIFHNCSKNLTSSRHIASLYPPDRDHKRASCQGQTTVTPSSLAPSEGVFRNSSVVCTTLLAESEKRCQTTPFCVADGSQSLSSDFSVQPQHCSNQPA